MPCHSYCCHCCHCSNSYCCLAKPSATATVAPTLSTFSSVIFLLCAIVGHWRELKHCTVVGAQVVAWCFCNCYTSNCLPRVAPSPYPGCGNPCLAPGKTPTVLKKSGTPKWKIEHRWVKYGKGQLSADENEWPHRKPWSGLG